MRRGFALACVSFAACFSVPCFAEGSDADTLFLEGMKLAEGAHWKEARQAFLRGEKISPKDARFPIELAGAAYKSGDRAGDFAAPESTEDASSAPSKAWERGMRCKSQL